MRMPRFSQFALGGTLVAALAACSSAAYNPYPVGAYPGAAPGTYPIAAAPAGVEYGRVANIQMVQGATGGNPSLGGAAVGAVAGALVGNVVGRSLGGVSARDTSTVLGGVGGAVLGSQVARERAGAAGAAAYRITVQTDQGVMRAFDVPSPGDLHVGDRVRVDKGVIYHY